MKVTYIGARTQLNVVGKMNEEAIVIFINAAEQNSATNYPYTNLKVNLVTKYECFDKPEVNEKYNGETMTIPNSISQ